MISPRQSRLAIRFKSRRCSHVVQSTSMLVCRARSIHRHSSSLCDAKRVALTLLKCCCALVRTSTASTMTDVLLSFAATVAGSVDVMTALLAHSPNLNIADTYFDQTPLGYALNNSSETIDCIAVMLINGGASLDALAGLECWFATSSTSAIQALLNRGVIVNQLRDFRSFTPLHAIATRPGWSADLDDVVNMLIDVCGIDLEARSFDGETCTHIAAAGRHEALRSFIAAGADVNTVNSDGQTPLHRVYTFECAVLLLAAGASLKARDRKGRTVLQTANVRSHIVTLLPAFVAAGADPGVYGQIVAALGAGRIDRARREIAKTRLDFVRQRAMHVCIGLQSLSLDALQMCEILQHSCGPLAPLIGFHQWWTIATTVKHFQSTALKHNS
jgi:ankyrin repeat protein